MKFYKFTLFTRFGDLPLHWTVYSPESFAKDCDAWAANDCGFTAEFKRADMYECSVCKVQYMPMILPAAGSTVLCDICSKER